MAKPRKQKDIANLRALTAIGLLSGLVLAYNELKHIWSPERVWGPLLTPAAKVTIAAYALLALSGLTILCSIPWPRVRLPFQLETIQGSTVLRWLIAAAQVAFIGWVYLYSAWQTVLTGPWTQLLFAAGAACLIHRIFQPRADLLEWGDLALTFSLFLFPRVVQELRVIQPEGPLAALAAAAGVVFCLGLIAVQYDHIADGLRLRLMRLRAELGITPRILFVALMLTPIWIRYGIGAGFYILYPNLVFSAWLLALSAGAFLITFEPDRWISLEAVGKSTGVLVLVSAITQSLLMVVDDPFSLSWSEGNRLYDYSLVFGQHLYDYPGVIPDPYNTPGRYGLWGILFLWNGLPIWAHRLWNAGVLTLPSLLFAWLATRKIQPPVLRTGMFLWLASFFIILAPLHPPFMIVAIIVAAFAFHRSPWVRGASLIAASLYAGISRWTWILGPGIWGLLTDLFLYYPARKGNWFQRLVPTAIMALLGVVPGLLLNIDNLFGPSSGAARAVGQPLLWYRLLPNPTLGPGILLLMVMITGPLIALLIYKIWTRRWRLDTFQLLSVWGILLGFLCTGLVISAKIGGGGDLHNLDMYIASLIFVITLGLTSQIQEPQVQRWPAWTLAMLCLLAILPAYRFTPFSPSAGSDAWLDLPSHPQSAETLEAIRAEVASASQRGEVLFMDQRQLLTFGYVRGVPFIPEYEKKYMMDQALSSNAEYFLPYYQDLARKRFSLIVTEPLKVNLKGSNGVFPDENDLWVTWVSAPTLCFYEPIMTSKEVGVQLLAPREDPTGCEKYLEQTAP
ncbi:MAG TPA: hypothetical protein VGJ22_13895 [Anaerolineales bacterium]|jgi:hypothetical protein